MPMIWVIITTIFILIALSILMANGDVGCFTVGLFAINVIVLVLTIASLVIDTQQGTNELETTTDITTIVTTAEPRYTATVKNADGSEVKYEIKSYETKEGTMTLTLKDGTKVFVPITNITISEHPAETTTETSN